MSEILTAGARLRAAVEAERPLQVVGTINAYAALLAEQRGLSSAIYLSGAGVANASFGLPDLGMTSLNDVCEDVRRITGACALPLLVDADTGWGGAFNIARTMRELSRAGAAGMHLEDQVAAKRCGHRPGKALVAADEMVDRIKAAVDARTDAAFVIMARTDAHAVEGQAAALERAAAYVAAGADMIFAEALTSAGRIPRVLRARAGAGARQHHRVRPDAAVYTAGARRRGRAAGAVSAVGVPRRAPGAGRGVPGAARRGHAARAWCPTCRRAPSSTRCSAITTTSSKLDELFGKSTMNESCRFQAEEIRGALGRHGRQHRAVHGRHAPATTCTTAATTSSRSPTRASSRRSRYLLIHERAAQPRGAGRLQGEAQVAARPAGGGAQRARSCCRRPATRWTCCARGASVLGCLLPEKRRSRRAPGRATSPTA